MCARVAELEAELSAERLKREQLETVVRSHATYVMFFSHGLRHSRSEILPYPAELSV